MIYFFMFLALLSGALDAVNGGQVKLSRLNPFKLTGLGFIFATPVYWAGIIFNGAAIRVPLDMIGLLLLQSSLFILANILWIYAQRISGLTRTLPYLTATPAVLLLVSPSIDGSHASESGVIGVLVLTVGLFIFNVEGNGPRTDLLAPLKNFRKDRGAQYMLLVALIYAVNASMDKAFSRRVEITLWLWLSHTFAGIVLIGLSYTKIGLGKQLGRFRRRLTRKDLRHIIVYSLILGLAMVVYCITVPRLIPPYLISLRRVGVVSAAFLLGHFWLNEKYADRTKLVGAAIMLTGMITILFSA